jgi:NAD(P)-dependent dehydrogenase (short-subunit alcohol dehydrogenase family)
VRTLAWELGPYGLRANLISPGGPEGPRLEAVIRGQAEARGLTYEEVHAEFLNLSALGRLPTFEDIGNAAVYLASDDAAAVTGEDMNISAGLAMC